MKRLLATIVFIGLLVCEAVGGGEASAAFLPGDRWAIVGDSITHSGSYHAWVWLYQLTRFPGRSFEPVNCGIAGDTAAGGVRRFAWDIAPVGAKVATVMFGMNDVSRGLYAAEATGADVPAKRRAALEAYEKNLRSLVASLEGRGTRVILITPSIFDQTAEIAAPNNVGVNEALAECGKIVRQIAAEKRLAVIDFHAPMTELNDELQDGDPAFTLTSADRIHPATPGHLVMAYYFLKAQGAPAEVSHLSIDGVAASVRESRNGAVGDLRATERGLAFTWASRALPFPSDVSFGRAMTWVPFVEELNQETLQISGLPSGVYVLKIDGVEVGKYFAAALAEGVNLATNAQTPQYQQAVEVLKLVQQHRLHVTETARNIALVEHQCAPEDKHPYTFERIQPYYTPRLTQLIASQQPTSNLLRIYKLYPEIKPREDADREKARQLAEDARRAAQPQPRKYELIRQD